jgi:hypothetical protein
MRIALAALLVVAMLFAQWLGERHRIQHAGWDNGNSAAAAAASAPDIDDNVSHSCAAFDAATLPHVAPGVPFIVPIVASAKVLALWVAFTSWDAPFTLHFSSRAPPPA